MIQFKTRFRFCALAIAVAGIILCMIDCPRYWELYSYFTIQSNIMCIILFAWGLRKETPVAVRGLATVCITLTFLVYHFMLRPDTFTLSTLNNVKNISNLFAHYLVPICTWADYVLFDPKRRIRPAAPLSWLAYPLLYLAYIKLICRPLGLKFVMDGQVHNAPYFFLDSDILSTGQITLWCIAIGAGFLLLSYIFYIVDRIFPN